MNVNSSRAPGSAQREAILVAATATFLRYGFKKTSMDDVAQAAGVSRQGLYLYFDTKDLLFREALQYLVSHMISTARSIVPRASPVVPQSQSRLPFPRAAPAAARFAGAALALCDRDDQPRHSPSALAEPGGGW